jgi:hypothetical protein
MAEQLRLDVRTILVHHPELSNKHRNLLTSLLAYLDSYLDNTEIPIPEHITDLFHTFMYQAGICYETTSLLSTCLGSHPPNCFPLPPSLTNWQILGIDRIQNLAFTRNLVHKLKQSLYQLTLTQ